jgi:hypothetical protein
LQNVIKGDFHAIFPDEKILKNYGRLQPSNKNKGERYMEKNDKKLIPAGTGIKEQERN